MSNSPTKEPSRNAFRFAVLLLGIFFLVASRDWSLMSWTGAILSVLGAIGLVIGEDHPGL
jgi:hypothetical protein